MIIDSVKSLLPMYTYQSSTAYAVVQVTAQNLTRLMSAGSWKRAFGLATFSACITTHTHTHKHTFNGPFSGTTQVSRYQKGKTNLDFAEARNNEWQCMASAGLCKSAPRSRQITTPAPHHSVFTGRMPFLPPNQPRQRTEGKHALPLYR